MLATNPATSVFVDIREIESSCVLGALKKCLSETLFFKAPQTYGSIGNQTFPKHIKKNRYFEISDFELMSFYCIYKLSTKAQ